MKNLKYWQFLKKIVFMKYNTRFVLEHQCLSSMLLLLLLEVQLV